MCRRFRLQFFNLVLECQLAPLELHDFEIIDRWMSSIASSISRSMSPCFRCSSSRWDARDMIGSPFHGFPRLHRQRRVHRYARFCDSTMTVCHHHGMEVECCVVAFHDTVKCDIGLRAGGRRRPAPPNQAPFLGAADVQTVDTCPNRNRPTSGSNFPAEAGTRRFRRGHQCDDCHGLRPAADPAHEEEEAFR